MKRSLLLAVGAVLALSVGTAPVAASETTTPTPTSASTAASSAPATQLEQVSAYLEPSIVYVGITWTGYVWDTYNKAWLNNGDPFTLDFQCTGYVVNPDGYIATAGHCVDPAEVTPTFYQEAAKWALNNGYYQSTTLTLDDVLGFGDYVVRNQDNKKRPDLAVTTSWSVSAGGVQTGKALPARVVKWKKFDQGDGALLKVEATDLNAIPLSTTDLEIGTSIVSIGYPGSVDLVADATFTPSFKEGAVSSKKTVSNGLLTVYEISAAVSGGMSGGPTVNLKGEVVGTNSFGINSAIETQQFNFVRPAETVRELLADAGTTNELSQDSQDYRAGLTAFFSGDKLTAVDKLQSVVDNQPTNEFAKKYLDKAEALPDPPEPVVEESDEDSGSSMLPLILGGVGLLLVVGVVAVVLLARRGKRTAQPAAPTGPTGPTGPAGAGYPAPGQPPAGPAYGQTAPIAVVPGASPPPSSGAPPAAPPSSPPPPSGASAPAAPASHGTFCANCGSRGDAGQKFCKNCGTAL